MLNQIIIVGKVKETPVVKETSSGIPYSNLIVETKRSFKNSEGIYETDAFSVLMWRGIAESCADVCNVGNLVGIKGRLQSSVYQKEDGNIFYNYEIVAEKVSFLNMKDE